MRLKLIGTGNAAGIPWFGCKCQLCNTAKANKELHRGPTCALLKVEGKTYLIDAGLMNISEKFNDEQLAGIFLTHFHPDHVQGLFHYRWGKGTSVPVYCPPDSEGCSDLYKHPGILDFQRQKKFETFEIDNLSVTPIPLIHSKVTFGYIFEYKQQRIAYLTDTKGLPPKTADALLDRALDLLVIDTSHPPGVSDKNHNNLDDSIEIHHQVRPGRTILTHISHDFDVWLHDNQPCLPDDMYVANDGLVTFPY
jgi:phosphoribosyl 1,2-cyclic phosphate phosphodiesterase